LLRVGMGKGVHAGEEISMEVGFTRDGDLEIEAVKAAFAREGFGEQIVLIGDAGAEASEEGQVTRYAARLKGGVPLDAAAGEYRCARPSARDRLDDDWNFADVSKPNLVMRVK
jgi:hypothetical protein